SRTGAASSPRPASRTRRATRSSRPSTRWSRARRGRPSSSSTGGSAPTCPATSSPPTCRRKTRASRRSSGPSASSTDVELGASRRRVPWGDLLVALGVLALGGFFLQGALALRVLPSYARIGPRFFPILVGVALLVCGVALVAQALRGVRGVPEDAEDIDAGAQADWVPVAVIGATLALHALLVGRLGFVLSTTLLFMGVALGFDERRVWRPAPVGLALSLAVYLAFTKLLGLMLPAGVLPLCRRSRPSWRRRGLAPAPRRSAAGGRVDRDPRGPPPRLLHRAHLAEPAVGLPGRHAGHRRRHPARHRTGADRGAAPARDLQARPDRELHHVRRHLLRRHVRRLHDVDPAEHARRVRLDHHGDRGQPDGQARPRRRRARYRRDRLVRGRDHRHGAAHVPRTAPGA